MPAVSGEDHSDASLAGLAGIVSRIDERTSHMQADIAELRAELRGDVAELRADTKWLRAEVQKRPTIATFWKGVGAIVTTLLALAGTYWAARQAMFY
jgi:hypothetical protein